MVAWHARRDGVVTNFGETGTITEEQRAKAHVKTAAQAREVLRRIGYPAMIKASEGGGGKGIRKVTREEDVEAAFRQVRSPSPAHTPRPCWLLRTPPFPPS